jgi:hypothetical protein
VNVTAKNQSASTITVAAAAGSYGGYEKVGVGDIIMMAAHSPLSQSADTYAARVTAKSSGTLTVAVGSSWSWATTGTAYCYKAIDSQIQYVDVMPDKDSKHFSSATYIFKRRGFYSAHSQMGGEWQNFGGGETLTRSELVFSDRVVKASRGTLGVHASSKRVLVPKEIQRGSYLSVGLRVKEAGSYWALAGVGIEIEGGSDRGNK